MSKESIPHSKEIADFFFRDLFVSDEERCSLARMDNCQKSSFWILKRGFAIHPDFQAEQNYIDKAFAILDQAHLQAKKLHGMVESGQGGTHQARFERDVISDQVNKRLSQLDIGDASLVFGRIDQENSGQSETFYIGRVAIWDKQQDPITVDWRAPIAEGFYRATGKHPMGLIRRRHFATRKDVLLGIEDEFFGEDIVDDSDGPIFKGRMTLAATMEQARTGRLGDIVATIQGEQDEIIRSPLSGMLIVQGGPGTGKTVVALHRAAYLLYTYRFPLEGQGVLVVGPNRVFLTYIEQVLPSLGEAGVRLAVLTDLIPRVKVRGYDSENIAAIKGSNKMELVVRNAIHDRQRPIRDNLRIGYGLQRLSLTVSQTQQIINEAQRRFRNHNSARQFVRDQIFQKLALSSKHQLIDPEKLQNDLASALLIRETLEWMWPSLNAEHLIHDLFGSRALLRSAAGNHLTNDEIAALYRPRSSHATEVDWTSEDVPILDEAQAQLGPRAGYKEEETIRTYGHIVVDEAQDLSPMKLRMLKRRSLNGSMTLVGDIAQATGAWAHDNWEGMIEALSQKSGYRFSQLTVGYRLPQPTMDVANRLLRDTQFGFNPPVAVREMGDKPQFVSVETPARLSATVVALVRSELEKLGPGYLAVIVPDAYLDIMSDSLNSSGIRHGLVDAGALEDQVTLVPVSLVKGLEVDVAVVVEPDKIITGEKNGLRALYVALTRATQRLTIVHTSPLPESLMSED